MTDTANQGRWEWAHNDPFGNNVPNENPAGVGIFTYSLRFPGQYYDVETGKHYNYYRDYDPAVGRYIESDPIGLDGGLNTFGYALLDPLGTSDATGLLPDGCLTCIVYGEAGGTNDDCQQAVAAVVFNRMGDGRRFHGQNSPCAVVSAAGQFDAFGSDRYKRCLRGCLTGKERYAADRSFFNSAGPFQDNTDNSTFFHDRTTRTPPHIARRIKSGEMSEVRVPGCSSFRFYKFRR